MVGAMMLAAVLLLILGLFSVSSFNPSHLSVRLYRCTVLQSLGRLAGPAVPLQAGVGALEGWRLSVEMNMRLWEGVEFADGLQNSGKEQVTLCCTKSSAAA